MIKIQFLFSFRGLCSWTPLGARPPDPRLPPFRRNRRHLAKQQTKWEIWYMWCVLFRYPKTLLENTDIKMTTVKSKIVLSYLTLGLKICRSFSPRRLFQIYAKLQTLLGGNWHALPQGVSSSVGLLYVDVGLCSRHPVPVNVQRTTRLKPNRNIVLLHVFVYSGTWWQTRAIIASCLTSSSACWSTTVTTELRSVTHFVTRTSPNCTRRPRRPTANRLESDLTASADSHWPVGGIVHLNAAGARYVAIDRLL